MWKSSAKLYAEFYSATLAVISKSKTELTTTLLWRPSIDIYFIFLQTNQKKNFPASVVILQKCRSSLRLFISFNNTHFVTRLFVNRKIRRDSEKNRKRVQWTMFFFRILCNIILRIYRWQILPVKFIFKPYARDRLKSGTPFTPGT